MPPDAARLARATQPRVPENSPLNVDVRFHVDSETNTRTVVMVNRITQEVIRTIPPEEIEKLTPGELLTLLA